MSLATATARVWEIVRPLSPAERGTIGRELIASVLPPEEFGHVPSLERRSEPPLSTAHHQQYRMHWDIPEGAKVLDVGSGGYPFFRATHLADMFPGGTTHRVEALKRDERPFTVVDIHALPYSDKSFDFVFCSHVLEHLDDPGRAIRELCRVGRAGYVEVPTRLSDVMFNFTRLPNHHRWHGLNQTGTLLLTEWTDRERRDLGSNHFFSMAHSPYRNPFQDFLEANWDLFFIGMKWTGSLPFVVLSKTGEVLDRS